MKKIKHLKEITIEELAAWIEKNSQIKWSSANFGPENQDKPGHLRGKYIRFNLDTRDMLIFNLTMTGAGEDIHVDFRQEGEGTLLDALDRILAKDEI